MQAPSRGKGTTGRKSRSSGIVIWQNCSDANQLNALLLLVYAVGNKGPDATEVGALVCNVYSARLYTVHVALGVR